MSGRRDAGRDPRARLMSATPERCGVLLAGGGSTRFGGSPKGLAALGATRVCEYALRALSDVCDEVVIAANDPDAARWFPGHRIVPDDVAGLGALGALETALLAAAGRTTVVCAWDMPFVSAALLDECARAVEGGDSCCVPVHADGRHEPLCAAYGPSCLALVTAMLARGERAAHRLSELAGGRAWRTASQLGVERAVRTFHNINTRDDLAKAESWLDVAPAVT
jgi:molybdopterin-guanine dinucleotide biosynthesis protein A